MNTTETGWHVADSAGRVSGPLTADEVFLKWRAGDLNADSMIRREGQDVWCSLTEVEPFATAIRHLNEECIRFSCPEGHEIVMARQFAGRRVKCKRCGAIAQVPAEEPPARTARASGRRRWLLPTAGGVALAAAAWAGFHFLVEPGAVRDARALIANGQFEQAGHQLTPFLQEHPQDERALYLLGLAALNDFAAAARGTDGARDERVQIARTVFLRTLLPDSRALEQARVDLAQTATLVPGRAQDRWTRALVIGQLRSEFKLAEPAALARQMLMDLKADRQAGSRGPWGQALVEQVLAWDPGCASDLFGAALPPLDTSARDLLRAVAALRTSAAAVTAGPAALAQVLLDRAGQHAAAGQWDLTEACLSTAGETAPEAVPTVADRRIALLRKRLAAGDAAGVAQALDSTAQGMPDRASDIGDLYVQAAAALANTDRGAAQRALARGLQHQPAAAENEHVAWLTITLAARIDEDKRTQCQSFLKNHATSPRRADVLLLIVRDACQAKSAPYLSDAADAAGVLLTEFTRLPALDADVAALVEALAAARQNAAAQTLAEQLLRAVPATAHRVALESHIDALRKAQGRGTLPPDLDDLADRAEKALRIMALSSAGAVRVLETNPHDVDVVEVADRCTQDQFSSEEKDILKRWVHNGGIAWVRNDVLKLFDVDYGAGGCFRHDGCPVAVTPETCAIVAGCRQAKPQTGQRHAIDLSSRGGAVVPLLATRESTTWWSLVRYGQGWISNVPSKRVALDVHDGARLWLNFQLFCLGWEIPGAPTNGMRAPQSADAAGTPAVSSSPESGAPEHVPEIATREALEQALAADTPHRVLWVRLEPQDISDPLLERLQEWVRAGHVLWVDSSLVRSFDFTKVIKAPAPDEPSSPRGRRPRGQAVANAGDSSRPEAMATQVWTVEHAIVNDLRRQTVSCALSARRPVIETTRADCDKAMTPLLGWAAPSRNDPDRVFIVCALRQYGEGLVVFRPAEIDTDATAGRQFCENLRRFSFEYAPSATPVQP